LDEFGVFGHFWHLECEGTNEAPQPILHCVHVDCLLEHVCMLPYTEKDEYMWVHMWHPSLWPDCFLGSDDNDHLFQPWLPITAVYCQLTAFATGNGLKAVTAYLLQ
jgi:hypothetical protein